MVSAYFSLLSNSSPLLCNGREKCNELPLQDAWVKQLIVLFINISFDRLTLIHSWLLCSCLCYSEIASCLAQKKHWKEKWMAVAIQWVWTLYSYFSCSGFHGHSLPVHFIQGLWDHVPCVYSAALHAQQQTAGKDGEYIFRGMSWVVFSEMKNFFLFAPQRHQRGMLWLIIQESGFIWKNVVFFECQ